MDKEIAKHAVKLDSSAKEGLAERQALADQAIIQLGRAGGNLKITANAVKKEDQDSISMAAADTIVNVIQMCDLYNINIMPSVFRKLQQIDRIDAT